MNVAQLRETRHATRELLCEFVASGGHPVCTNRASSASIIDLHEIAEVLAKVPVWGSEEILWIRFVFEVSAVIGHSGVLLLWSGEREAEVLRLVAAYQPSPDPAKFAQEILRSMHRPDWSESEAGTPEAPFHSPFANFAWRHGDFQKGFSFHQPKLLAALATRRPEVIEHVLQDPAKTIGFLSVNAHRGIMQLTDRFDPLLVEKMEHVLFSGTSLPGSDMHSRYDRIHAFIDYHAVRDHHSGRWSARVLELARSPEFAGTEQAAQLLLEKCPDEALALVAAADLRYRPSSPGPGYRRILEEALADFSGLGGRFLSDMLASYYFAYGIAAMIHEVILSDPTHMHAGKIRDIYLREASTRTGKRLLQFWQGIAKADAGLFKPEWKRFSTAKGRQLRETAAEWLQKHGRGPAPGELSPTASVDERIGGATLLAKANGADAIEKLKQIHATDPSKQVREAVAKLLEQAGHEVAPEPEKPVTRFENFANLEESLAAKAKTIRPPAAPWLNAESLPSLFTRDGVALSERARTFLFQVQAREGSGELSADAAPLLEHLDRDRNAPFAHALLDQWFASDMKASTRWAVDVAGLTGDDSLIPRLVRPIPDWCKLNAGKRAEWAVRAIALIGTPGALRELDALTHRYRNQRRYVAAAATEAIRLLAAIQGISEDEIAERIVPDFGFDESGQRSFSNPASEEAVARLRPDLKVAWLAADGRESAKPPAGLPSDEMKEWAKLFKQAVVSQTLRLERAMVEGRRWEPAAWQERFDAHPLFRCFAGSLVWAVYDAGGAMLRTFRRYPNGIFADAKGEPEEFENAASVGLPHPMDLDDAVLADWAAHLKRFKVTPAFPQIARPVERPDPLHGNRHEIRIAEGKTLDAALLRQRMLGRGWSPAPTGNAGLVFGCFRNFRAAGIEAHLALEGFYAGSGRGDDVDLGVALFARPSKPAMKIRPGTTPLPDSPLVMRFDEVPAVVWSETMADLKAIIGA
ncbi:DUF4132 domain-containing protein [Luteolibacter arcticus]|uniref:DUF4132 domain-containing protein n=1 Tax=Luteolibacter arcticus TaxID=1581411 RepID=A0ABT3GJF3_9BACT|nr:DUF4132 domain-containing protein [Luteolibacter arcticus]MCW1923611.1 DUF4132 domain-containing protein [Luteolibacter arcticus]